MPRLGLQVTVEFDNGSSSSGAGLLVEGDKKTGIPSGYV
jgi:hypothetical protein